MYIFLGCIANVNVKTNEYTRSSNDEKYQQNKQIDLLPYVNLSKDVIPFTFLKILDRNALLGKCTAAIVFVIVDWN